MARLLYLPLIGLLAACSSTVEGDADTGSGGPPWRWPTDTAGQDAGSDGTRAGDVIAAPDHAGAPDTGPADTPWVQPDNGKPPSDVQNPQDTQEPACTPGTECYKDKWVIMGSKLTVIVGSDSYNPDYYFLDLLPPGTLTTTVIIRSTGFNQLTLVDAFLEPNGNPFISLQWATAGYPAALPATLMPNQETQLTITYSPTGDSLPYGSTLTIWCSDPDHPVKQVAFFPKQSGPDIMIPDPAKNYGCGSYCHGREFTIENGGNKDLVLQNMQFEKPSGEWTLSGAPGPGTTIKAAGSPGYAPVTFSVDYCDQDGNTLDDNKLAIYSNDPDENPAFIFLHIIQPAECP